MQNIELQIYLTQFKAFFNQNPQELVNLIGNTNPELFYCEVEKQAIKNSVDSENFELTQKQLIDILLEINKDRITKRLNPLFETNFGVVYLN